MPAPRSRSGHRFACLTLLAGAASLGTLGVLAARLPEATADPAGGATTPTTSPSAAPDAFRIDDYGYVGSAARCDATEAAVVIGRTARAQVAICVDRDGQLEYRGVRLSDQATVRMPASRSGDGSIIASNDTVTYAVSPTMLLVSDGDTVLYRDAWVEFREPRFSGGSTASTSSAAPAATSAAVPTTTVSTTTVTLPPRTAGN